MAPTFLFEGTVLPPLVLLFSKKKNECAHRHFFAAVVGFFVTDPDTILHYYHPIIAIPLSYHVENEASNVPFVPVDD